MEFVAEERICRRRATSGLRPCDDISGFWDKYYVWLLGSLSRDVRSREDNSNKVPCNSYGGNLLDLQPLSTYATCNA